MPHHHVPAQQKLFDAPSLEHQLETWRKTGDRIVFTNGCFDILHAGHIRYLEAAASLGERLIIAVNDDASVRRLKGETRPINALASRMYLLASLGSVDAVVSFSEDTPEAIISRIRPDILVKGGDYSPENIVGAPFVLSYGGVVKVIPFVEGFSTSNLEQRILDLHRFKIKAP